MESGMAVGDGSGEDGGGEEGTGGGEGRGALPPAGLWVGGRGRGAERHSMRCGQQLTSRKSKACSSCCLLLFLSPPPPGPACGMVGHMTSLQVT